MSQFRCPPIHDRMGETFSADDYNTLAYHIDYARQHRPRPTIPLKVLELGTWSGQSTLAIARPNTLVYCVSDWSMPAEEPPKGSRQRPEREWLILRQGAEPSAADSVAFRTFVRNTEGVIFRNAMPILYDPFQAYTWWPERVDAAYINCDDSAVDLRGLIIGWSQHVRPGGHIYGRYKGHTVEALTGRGFYTVDGAIWKYSVTQGA